MAKKMKGPVKLVLGLFIIGGIYFGLKHFGVFDSLAKPASTSSIPTIDDVNVISGTTAIRLGHWTWNTHQSWAYANKGKETKADSLFAKNGITLQFIRMEEIPIQVASLAQFAKSFKSGQKNPGSGVHFFTIMGDAGGLVMNMANNALKDIDSDYEAEIIGFGGFSAGEDKFMGLPEWKTNPQSARGGLVTGVKADGDWNVMIFWCAQNKVPFNSDKKYYDPNALNFLNVGSYIKAAEFYIANKPVEFIFKSDGKDYKGKPIKEGDKGFVAINGVVTWTPGDKNIADQRGGLVSIASTKEYSNQMPQYIVGLKQWNRQNKGIVTKMLASIYQASDKINHGNVLLKARKVRARSAGDIRWEAAKYAKEIFGSESQDYWYKYFNIVKVRDKKGLTVEIGGSSVSNLPRNIKFFGLDGGVNIGKIVYNRFAKLAMHYYPEVLKGYPKWEKVFNPEYLLAVKGQFAGLSKSADYLPVFKKEAKSGSQIGELSYNIAFDSGKATFKPSANSVLSNALEELVIAANARIEIHGHTDTQGDGKANMSLSRRRASAVEKWFVNHAGSSFPQNRVKIVPHGENNPLVNDFVGGKYQADKMAQNRRVIVKIFKTSN